ncbi:hypothetical protein NA57DRAFT_78541 [Rhizodiscina lignyota]|uniref:Uncharacterized protein n=1 Tax=Rhizodiscina lignyota TaxID=1504668 RepID=A0A9P4IC29_9PEZI|nr:hypothetical protein NA57DRAFT_78541 [Rhizodiscina lignyota]
MPDIDHAFRRMAMRDAAAAEQGYPVPLPRVRRGALRSWEDAFTYHNQIFAPAAANLEYAATEADHGHWPDAQRTRSSSIESSTGAGSEISDSNWQEAELSPPRYRKDLAKLGVPRSIDSVSLLSQQFSSGLTLDGAVDAPGGDDPLPVPSHQLPFVHRLRHNPVLPRSPLHQSHVVSSPERNITLDLEHKASSSLPMRTATFQKARAATYSNDSSVDDGYLRPQHYTGDRSISAEPYTTTSYGPFTNPAASMQYRAKNEYEEPMTLRSQNSHEPLHSGATSMSIRSAGLLRPSTQRISSMSTPNLTSRIVSSEIIHSRTSSVSIRPNTPLTHSLPHDPRRSSYLGTHRSFSAGSPILEILGDYISPLEQLEQDASSEYSSAPSITSFHTARTHEMGSHIRFPSFGSPDKQSSPLLPSSGTGDTPEVESSSIDNSEALLAKVTAGSPSPVRIRSVALPPPLQSPVRLEPARTHVHRSSTVKGISQRRYSQTLHTHIEHPRNAQPYTYPPPSYAPALTAEPSRSDSVLDITRPAKFRSPSSLLTQGQSANLWNPGWLETPETFPLPSGRRTPVPQTASSNRTFAVFSPGLDSFDDYGRYPNPHMILNRRSLPVPVPSALTRSETVHTSRRPERPYSHGARPRDHHQTQQYPASHHGSAPQPSRGFLNRPPEPPRSMFRTLPSWQRNQENDGSAEEDLMREELQTMEARMRGGVPAEHTHARGGQTAGQTAGVLDDTPPREGRFERLMRS